MTGRILITGATGFIGKYLVPKIADGYDVTIMVRDIEKAKKMYENINVNILYGDMNNVNTLIDALKDIDHIDYIINTVGGGPLTSNRNLYDTIYKLNVETLKNLIFALDSVNLSDKIRLFVHISSLAAMGALNSSETYNEETPCKPVLPYEIAKYESEEYLRDICESHRFKVLILRPPQVYGVESKEIRDMVRLIKWKKFPLFSDGSGSLPLIHAEDFTDAVRSIVQQDHMLTKNFNIYMIGDENYKYTDIVDIVKITYGEGGCIRLPYSIGFAGIRALEGIFRLFNKIEPINVYRLNSMCRKRKIDSSRLKKDFKIDCRFSLKEFIKGLN